MANGELIVRQTAWLRLCHLGLHVGAADKAANSVADGAADGVAEEVANVVSNEGADEVACVAADGLHGASVEQLMGYTWSLGS